MEQLVIGDIILSPAIHVFIELRYILNRRRSGISSPGITTWPDLPPRDSGQHSRIASICLLGLLTHPRASLTVSGTVQPRPAPIVKRRRCKTSRSSGLLPSSPRAARQTPNRGSIRDDSTRPQELHVSMPRHMNPLGVIPCAALLGELAHAL